MSDSLEQTLEAWNRVKREWLATREVWQDSAAEEFENQVWQNFETEARAIIKALELLQELKKLSNK